MRNRFKTFIDSFFFWREKAAENKTSVAPSISSGGVFVLNPQGTAMNVATVYGCVDVLAGAVSSLPIMFEKKKGDVYVKDEGLTNYLLNVQPCEYMSAPDMWRIVVQDLLLDGNAYIIPKKDKETGEVWRLSRANPTSVMHNTISNTYNVSDIEAAISGTYSENEIIHIKNFTRDGKTGISTLSFARISSETALCGEHETLNRFRNGGNVRGIVSDDAEGVRGFGEYQDEELAKTAESIDEKFSSGQKIVSMPGAAKFSPITLSSADMQFLESRKFNAHDICRFFRVHPQYLFFDTASNYKSAEMANVAFLSTTLNPLLKKIEMELTRKLIPMRHIGKYRIRFDREGVFAADLDSKSKYLQSMVGVGMYTVNELRAKENRPSVEGGDKVLVSANLKDINDMSVKAAETSADVEQNE